MKIGPCKDETALYIVFLPIPFVLFGTFYTALECMRIYQSQQLFQIDWRYRYLYRRGGRRRPDLPVAVPRSGSELF